MPEIYCDASDCLCCELGLCSAEKLILRDGMCTQMEEKLSQEIREEEL